MESELDGSRPNIMKSRGITDRQAARWARTRRGGRLRFILLYGVLGWGVLAGIIAAALRSWVEHGSFAQHVARPVMVLAVTGVGWGAWMWRVGERGYRRWEQGRAGELSA